MCGNIGLDAQCVNGHNPSPVKSYDGSQGPVERASVAFLHLRAHVDAAARVKREVLVDVLLTILVGEHLLFLVCGKGVLPYSYLVVAPFHRVAVTVVVVRHYHGV